VVSLVIGSHIEGQTSEEENTETAPLAEEEVSFEPEWEVSDDASHNIYNALRGLRPANRPIETDVTESSVLSYCTSYFLCASNFVRSHLAIDICVSVRLSVKRVHPDKNEIIVCKCVDTVR